MKSSGINVRVARFAGPLSLLALLAPAIAAFAEPAAEPAGEAAYLGRWDLTLHAPHRDYPSWLELTAVAGTLRARLVSRWGHARYLPEASITNGHLRFVSPKDAEASRDDMVFDGQLVGHTLEGVISGQDGPVDLVGRARALARAHRGAALGQATAAVQWQEPGGLALERSRREGSLDRRGWRAAQPGQGAGTHHQPAL
jgi:hypothetical protein